MRKINKIITSCLNQSVIIGEDELTHALEKHFSIPKVKLTEIIEMVLTEPDEIFLDEKTVLYHLFYKIETGQYLVVVLKSVDSKIFFSTIYPTGSKIRSPHKKLKRIKK